MAALFWLSFKRRAMVWRSRVILTRSSRAASSTGTGALGGAAAVATATGAKAAAGVATARATSSFITRPSRPVAVTASRSKPASAMAFLADGASSISVALVAGALIFSAAFSRAGGAFVAAVGLAAAPASLILAKSASTPTVSPSCAMISCSVPDNGLGTSTVTLSVSSSHSISSAVTLSPGFLNHVATVASVTDSPSVGTRTSMVMG